ncbi:MAG: hypothetical protein ACYS8X_03510 [Planctomycetota bacterium]|jgi:hypothetical protein
MPITTDVDLWGQLTVHTGVGELTIEEVNDTIRAFYNKTPTKNVLWDFRRGIIHNLTVHQIRHSIFEVGMLNLMGLADVRIDGRTAMVVSTAEDFGLARVAATLLQLEELPFESDVFFDLDKATDWLEEVSYVAEPRRRTIPKTDSISR